MNGKSMSMLMAAILCGLGAMYGTTRLISKDKSVPIVDMQDVLVASRDLKVEEVVKPDATRVIRMAKNTVPPGAFTSSKDVEDRWVQIGILEGEPIIDRKLAARGSPPGLVARIPPGMRAFAVEVNEQTGVSGFVLPDHRVDVVQIEPNNSGGPPEAETVLQDVLVLASGQTFTRPEDRSIQARTVTLAVTPDQVDVLVSARSRGALTLALRGLNDHTQIIGRMQKARTKKEAEPAKPKEVVVVQAPTPPPAPPPAPAPAPTPVEPPLPPPPPPARFVTVYRGIHNKQRDRIDQPPDQAQDEPLATTASTTVPQN